MATRSKKRQTEPASNVTAQSVKENYEANKEKLDFAKKFGKVIKLSDAENSLSRGTLAMKKEQLRLYLTNPVRYSKELRQLSRYLYYRSQVYRRLIQYNASMINLEYRSVIPIADLTKNVNTSKLMKSFYETSMALQNTNLALEFYKAYVIAWREDVFYGCAYYDETGFFILPLDPDYCKVTGMYREGDLAFDMNMSYFDAQKRKKQLEYWGEPFISMYNAYQKDKSNGKWQRMPDEHNVCLKVNIDDWELPTPPYMGLFNNLINLEDLADIMAIAERQQIDKMIWAEIPLKKNSNAPDDFAVDAQTAADYFSKMTMALPDYVSAVISPIPLNSISFTRDQATDVSKLENATKSILTVSGGVQTLCPPEGTTAYTAAIKSDEEYAISSLLPQTQAVVNRLISYKVKNPAKIKFLEITKYTKEEYKAELVKDMNYGAPHLLTLSALAGFNELETISMAYLQQNLDVETLFKPLQTAATQSNKGEQKEAGRPEHEPGEQLTDDGEKSIDKRDKKR